VSVCVVFGVIASVCLVKDTRQSERERELDAT
jgi:hypothetical protein